MAIGTVGFFPACSYIYGVLKIKCIPDSSVLHHIRFALTNNCVAKVTVLCDFLPVFCCKKIIVAPETPLYLKMSDMIGVSIISYLH